MKAIATLSAALVLGGAAVGLACPASAEPLSGSYIGTMISGSMVGLHLPAPVNFNSCGSGCTSVQFGSGPPSELHPQGDNWTGTTISAGCNISVNAQTLIMDWCGDQYQLTRN